MVKKLERGKNCISQRETCLLASPAINRIFTPNFFSNCRKTMVVCKRERVSITSLLFWYFSKIFSLIDCPIFFGWFLFFKMNNMGKWTHFYTQLNLELSLPLPNKKGEERRVNFLGLADTKGQWVTLRWKQISQMPICGYKQISTVDSWLQLSNFT